MAIKFNRNFNVNRVITRLMRAILALYVGGTVLSAFGDAMVNTTSALYTGLSLIGWTVGSSLMNSTTYGTTCGGTTGGGVVAGVAPNVNCITATSGSGILSVIGIMTIAQVVTEFINF